MTSLSGKKVLVTGADGFIGSHLVELLVQRDAEVRAFCLYNSTNSWGWLDDSPMRGSFEVISGDVRDPSIARSAVKGVDYVFNLAALIAIPYSYAAPQSYVETNIRGTTNMLEAALGVGVTRFLQISTSEVYGTARYVPIDESHVLQPQSPYSASKIAADALARSFHFSFGLPLTIVRPFNTYGPRQSARAVIPTIICQLLAGRDRLKLGSLTPTRDLTFVLDTCAGMIALAETDAALGETVNIGSNFEISIGDLVDLLQRVVGTAVPVETDDDRIRPGSSEVERLWCDNKKLVAMTGFKPETALKTGLSKTVDWLRDPRNLARYKPELYSR